MDTFNELSSKFWMKLPDTIPFFQRGYLCNASAQDVTTFDQLRIVTYRRDKLANTEWQERTVSVACDLSKDEIPTVPEWYLERLGSEVKFSLLDQKGIRSCIKIDDLWALTFAEGATLLAETLSIAPIRPWRAFVSRYFLGSSYFVLNDELDLADWFNKCKLAFADGRISEEQFFRLIKGFTLSLYDRSTLETFIEAWNAHVGPESDLQAPAFDPAMFEGDDS